MSSFINRVKSFAISILLNEILFQPGRTAASLTRGMNNYIIE